MKIEELWPQLEAAHAAAAGRRGASGWVLRQLRPEPTCPLHAAVELSTGRRGLVLRIAPALLPPRRRWPVCRGLEVVGAREGAQILFGVALKDARHADVFTTLAEDLARRVTAASDEQAKLDALLGGLTRWQKFLAASIDGLGDEAQRGLWGELRVLRDLFLPALGNAAVSGWKGPSKAHQDFQFPGGAVEVKTTLAKQPQVVRIASERQLDAADWPALFLHVIALDVREGRAESLPDIVAAVRDEVATDAAARETLEDALLAAGYFDAHSDRYSGRGYVVRSERTFRVKRGFPAIVEKDLPAGIGSVTYGLTVEACARFAVGPTKILAALARPGRA